MIPPGLVEQLTTVMSNRLLDPLEILLEPLEDDRQVHRDITMTSDVVSVKRQSAGESDIAPGSAIKKNRVGLAPNPVVTTFARPAYT